MLFKLDVIKNYLTSFIIEIILKKLKITKIKELLQNNKYISNSLYLKIKKEKYLILI